ncbi:hypothetical protein [Sphingomonas gei]|uniref:hypothetical protein n=1 Tax=Sphingomonas gei TaxID=1395960 RepID=UPI0014410996|nr:hypothetical protein [Sphingomonas gei]
MVSGGSARAAPAGVPGQWSPVATGPADPKHGADLTSASPEVTSTPEHVWRK